LNVVDTAVGRVGALLCWENFMPAARMALYAQNVEIYCAPTADHRDNWHASMQHIGREGSCFVIGNCICVPTEALPEDLPGREALAGSGDWVNRGQATVVSPRGEVIAGPMRETAAILTAEIDLEDVRAARRTFDVAGHYARPDVFTLTVDRNPRAPVHFQQGSRGPGQTGSTARRQGTRCQANLDHSSRFQMGCLVSNARVRVTGFGPQLTRDGLEEVRLLRHHEMVALPIAINLVQYRGNDPPHRRVAGRAQGGLVRCREEIVPDLHRVGTQPARDRQALRGRNAKARRGNEGADRLCVIPGKGLDGGRGGGIADMIPQHLRHGSEIGRDRPPAGDDQQRAGLQCSADFAQGAGLSGKNCKPC
jgi:hypothetical protein